MTLQWTSSLLKSLIMAVNLVITLDLMLTYRNYEISLCMYYHFVDLVQEKDGIFGLCRL